MAGKTAVLRYLILVDRVASWALLLLLVIFFITGYSMTGGYGFDRLVSVGDALSIHTTLGEAVIALLAYHVCVRGYLELKRLRILKR